MGKKKRVLVVDDEPAVLNVVARMVERLGYQAVTTLQGKEALRIVEEENIEILLLDVILKDMTIAELVNRVHTFHGPRRIILMSGHFQQLEIRIAGTMPFLQKPFTIDELRDALAQAEPVDRELV
jgi:DNA-binding NtrC family response regulator